MVKYSDELTAAIAKRRKEKAKAKPPVAPPRLRRGLKKPKGTHKMPDGTVMSGKTHSKDSKPVKKAKKKMPKMPDMKAVQKKVAEKAKKKLKFKVVKKLPEKAAPAKTFDDFYTGAGTDLNQFINDIIDLRSEKTNRKVGVRGAKARFKKLIKKNPNPTKKEIMEFYKKEYPDNDYYQDF